MNRHPNSRAASTCTRILSWLIFVAISATTAYAEPVNTQDPYDLYNEGREYFSTGEYDTAALLFTQSAYWADRGLDADAFYNLGNTFFRMAQRAKDADISAAIQNLSQAAIAYRESLNRQARNEDARYNLELSRRLMKYLLDQQKKQQEQQKNSKDSQKDQKGDTSASGQKGSPERKSPDNNGKDGKDDPQGGPQQPPKDSGKSFSRQNAEKDLKDRLKDIEDQKQQLYEAARRKGVDPEADRKDNAGVMVGGGYKDW